MLAPAVIDGILIFHTNGMLVGIQTMLLSILGDSLKVLKVCMYAYKINDLKSTRKYKDKSLGCSRYFHNSFYYNYRTFLK